MNWLDGWILGTVIAGVAFIFGVIALIILNLAIDSGINWKGLITTLFVLATIGFIIGQFLK